MKQPVNSDFNHSFSLNQNHSVRTICHVMRSVQQVKKQPFKSNKTQLVTFLSYQQQNNNKLSLP